MERNLGRLVEFDERSRAFPIRELLKGVKKPRSYTWRCETHLDQGRTSSCVGHAWAHEIAARPAVDTVTSKTAMDFYHFAQKVDPWPGEEPVYEGTSVLAGAKAAMDAGRITEYRWAFSLNDLILAVGYKGPAVIGVPWYEGMMATDAKGLIHPSGRAIGGHAVMVNGVSVRLKTFRIHNSWGKSWGRGGDAFISFEDMDTLLQQQGEACIPVKRVRSY